MGLRVDTEPGAEPLRTSDLIASLGTLPEMDEQVDVLIVAARKRAETYTGRALITQTLVLNLDRFPCGPIVIPRPPLQSVSSIKYIDDSGVQQTLSTSLYRVVLTREPAIVEPAYGETWPATRTLSDAVEVEFVAGYGDDADAVPANIKHAITMMVGEWLEYREGVANVREIPNSVKFLLNGERLGSLFAGAGWGQ